MSKSLPGRDLAPACAASCGATTARETRPSTSLRSFLRRNYCKGAVERARAEFWDDGAQPGLGWRGLERRWEMASVDDAAMLGDEACRNLHGEERCEVMKRRANEKDRCGRIIHRRRREGGGARYFVPVMASAELTTE
jgi:hypothetical protein